MRKYAMKEEGDEDGAAGYIAKNIDGYALEGERDFETGELLSDAAAAVTARTATWRIRSLNLTETFN